MSEWSDFPDGKFFKIKSESSGLVFEVLGGGTDPETPVETAEEKVGKHDSQLFYEDLMTGTVRTKLNDYCLEIMELENCLIINPYEPMCRGQQWMIADNKIQHRDDLTKVLDIAEASTEPGARICGWELTGKENQRFKFEYLPARYMYIKSMMHGKVMDVKKGNPAPGTQVISYSKNKRRAENQLWYEDKRGLIRSVINHFVLDNDKKDKFCLQPYMPGENSQGWIFTANRIVNIHNPSLVADIYRKRKFDGVDIVTYQYNGGENQHWELEYV